MTVFWCHELNKTTFRTCKGTFLDLLDVFSWFVISWFSFFRRTFLQQLWSFIGIVIFSFFWDTFFGQQLVCFVAIIQCMHTKSKNLSLWTIKLGKVHNNFKHKRLFGNCVCHHKGAAPLKQQRYIKVVNTRDYFKLYSHPFHALIFVVSRSVWCSL